MCHGMRTQDMTPSCESAQLVPGHHGVLGRAKLRIQVTLDPAHELFLPCARQLATVIAGLQKGAVPLLETLQRPESSIRFRPSALLCGVERITQSRRPGQSRVFDTVHHHVESGGYASLSEHRHSDFEVVSVTIVKGNCHRPG